MDLKTGASGWFGRHLTRIGSGRIFPVRRRRGAPQQDEQNPRASSAVRPVAAIGRAARAGPRHHQHRHQLRVRPDCGPGAVRSFQPVEGGVL